MEKRCLNKRANMQMRKFAYEKRHPACQDGVFEYNKVSLSVII